MMDEQPLPSETETLAATLYQHALAIRQRHSGFEALIEQEHAAQETAEAESAVLRAEIAQYPGWIDESLDGGAAYRLSKALADERERRMMLENEVATLRERLASASSQLKSLMHHATTMPQQQQARAAEDALTYLSRVRELGGGRHDDQQRRADG